MEIFIQNSFMTMPLRVPSACCHDIGISSALVAKLKKKNVNLINSGFFFLLIISDALIMFCNYSRDFKL